MLSVSVAIKSALCPFIFSHEVIRRDFSKPYSVFHTLIHDFKSGLTLVKLTWKGSSFDDEKQQ